MARYIFFDGEYHDGKIEFALEVQVLEQQKRDVIWIYVGY